MTTFQICLDSPQVFECLFNNATYSDFRFKFTSGRELHVMKGVLAVWSEMFKTMFETESATMELVNSEMVVEEEEEPFVEMIRFMYSQRMDLEHGMMETLLFCCHKFQVWKLYDLILNCISENRSDRGLIEQVIKLLFAGLVLDSENLINACKEVIEAYGKKMADTEAFSSLSREELKEFFGVGLNLSQLDVFSMVVQWVKFNEPERSEWAADLIIAIVDFKAASTELLSEAVQCRLVNDNAAFLRHVLKAQTLETTIEVKCYEGGLSGLWGNYGKQDALSFSCNKSVALQKVSVCVLKGGRYMLSLTIHDNTSSVELLSNYKLYITNNTQSDYIIIPLPYDIRIVENRTYTICAMINGPRAPAVKKRYKSVTTGPLTVLFSTSSLSHNGTTDVEGQFPVFYFKLN